MNLIGQFGEHVLEVLACEFPLKRFGVLLIEGLEFKESCLDRLQIMKVVGRKYFSLDDGEVDFDLVEPTGVYGRVDLDGIGIPAPQTLYGVLTHCRL